MRSLGWPAQLVIVRHGRSLMQYAKAGHVFLPSKKACRLVKGIPDHEIALVDRGKNQALQTGVALRDRFGTPHCIIHSGYVRTTQTADYLLNAYSSEECGGITTIIDPRIRERDTGHTYGMTASQARKNFPYLQEYWKTSGTFFAVPPGGESLCQMLPRIASCIEMIREDWAEKTVYVVTHGGTIKCIRYLLEELTYNDVDVMSVSDNCGVTTYGFDPAKNKLLLHMYNDVYWKD